MPPARDNLLLDNLPLILSQTLICSSVVLFHHKNRGLVNFVSYKPVPARCHLIQKFFWAWGWPRTVQKGKGWDSSSPAAALYVVLPQSSQPLPSCSPWPVHLSIPCCTALTMLSCPLPGLPTSPRPALPAAPTLFSSQLTDSLVTKCFWSIGPWIGSNKIWLFECQQKFPWWNWPWQGLDHGRDLPLQRCLDKQQDPSRWDYQSIRFWLYHSKIFPGETDQDRDLLPLSSLDILQVGLSVYHNNTLKEQFCVWGLHCIQILTKAIRNKYAITGEKARLLWWRWYLKKISYNRRLNPCNFTGRFAEDCSVSEAEDCSASKKKMRGFSTN